MGAKAYATGDHVVLGDGADLHTAAHEAAHVIQQRGGVQLKGGVGESGDAYERHADQVADQVVQGRFAESLLDRFAARTPAGGTNSDAPVQQMKDLASGGRVMTVEDAAEKRRPYETVLANLQAKLGTAPASAQAAINAQITKLQAALAKFNLLPDTEAFVNVRIPQTPAIASELHIDLEFGDYRVGDNVANGTYEFVIQTSNPDKVLMTKGTGHNSIGGEEPLYFAGTATFAIGDLVSWNNDTGHYRTDAAHAHQAQIPKSGGLPYLPMAKFKLFVVP